MRPKIKEKATVALESVAEADIKVQIISGINIPIRSESLQAIEALVESINKSNNRNRPVGRDAPQFGAGARNPPSDNRFPPVNDPGYNTQYDRDYNRPGSGNYNNRPPSLDNYNRPPSPGRYDRPPSPGRYNRPSTSGAGNYNRPSTGGGNYNRPQGYDNYDRPRTPADDRYNSPNYNRPRPNYPEDDYDRNDYSRSGYDRNDYSRSGYDRSNYDRGYEGGYESKNQDESSLQNDGGDSENKEESDSFQNDGGDTPPRYNDRPGGNPGFGGQGNRSFGRDNRTDFGNNFLNVPGQDRFQRPDSRGARTQFDRTIDRRNDGGYGASNLNLSQNLPPGIGPNRNYPDYSGYGSVVDPYRNTFQSRGLGGSQFNPGGYNQSQYGPPNNRRPDQMGAVEKAKLELTGIYKSIKGSTFVEVRYSSDRPGNEISQVKRSRECKGSFPDWNETLSFKIKASNGKNITEDEIIKGNDTLYFSIFDKHETERRVPNTNKHEITVENKFLGSFSVKLISILQNIPKMEGHIRVDRPMSLQGYGMLPSGMLSSNIFNKQIDTDLLPTYITLSINVDPLLELPAENEYDYYSGGEVSRLLRAGALWANSHRKIDKDENKIVKVFGENVERKSILLCRYITKQPPPEDLINFNDPNEVEYAIQLAARFVSLIPFIEDNRAFEDMPDLWCTSQEFIDFNGGDYEEHAILLCNLFNYIDDKLNEGKVKSYIILGNAVPEGYTTYVLRRNVDNNHVEVWDAIKGQAYFFGRKIEKHKC